MTIITIYAPITYFYESITNFLLAIFDFHFYHAGFLFTLLSIEAAFSSNYHAARCISKWQTLLLSLSKHAE